MLRSRKAVGLICGICATLLALGGCATPPPESDPEAVAAFKQLNDPYEPFNRTMFDINLALDKAILKPIAFVYKEVVPQPIQYNIHSFLENLRAPVIFVNDLLQGEFDRAGTTLLRFGMNSTFGLAGILDFATEAGIEKHDEDFGQTLAVYGTGSGPYLVLPIFGPSNPRDAVGLLVDMFMDPFGYFTSDEFRIARFAGTAVDKRARRYDEINDLERTSLDFYAAVRSLYRQRRADEIRNGAPAEIKAIPEMSALPNDSAPPEQGKATSK